MENKSLRGAGKKNEKEMKETIEKNQQNLKLVLWKNNRIDKTLARLIKKQREKNQINKNINENGEIKTDNTEIQNIMRLLSHSICQ